MRFLGYTLANEAETPTEPPRPELYEEMGAFVEEAVKAGVIVATGGIAPTSEGAKVSLKDGEFTTACAQSCASKALVFGDLNDPNSEVARLSDSNRGTKLLGELGTKPNVTYLERGTWEDATHG